MPEIPAPSEPEGFLVDESEIRNALATRVGELTAEGASLRSALRLVSEERKAMRQRIQDLTAELETLRAGAPTDVVKTEGASES